MKKYNLAYMLLISFFLITIYSNSADYGRPAGLMKIELQPGKETLTSNPFDSFDPTPNSLFSEQLCGAINPENADQIRIWDSSIQDFSSAFLAGFTGDPDRDGRWFKDNINWEPADITLYAGIGFFIKNNQAMSQNIFISGKIPLDDSRILTLQPNLNLISYPFPSKILLNNSDLKKDGSKGGLNINDSPDLIITAYPETAHWLLENAENQNSGKWHDESGEISSLELKPGSGYWYDRESISSLQWSENRPYLNPFNLDPCTPSIAGMMLNPSHDGIILDIDCTGEPGELLEIFFKDIGANDPLVTECGWSLADQNIPTSEKNRIVWTDAGYSNTGHPFADRTRINSVFMRIYIVSRQDIDSDNDGISNGRERFVYGTNPDEPDTDGDGIPDGDEVNAYLTNPNSVDSDTDGYSDSNEISLYHTNPNDPQDNPSVMPAVWKYADIGSMPSTVSAKYFNGSYTVKGAGSDIYGTSDKFNYLFRELTGNFEMTVRIINQQNTNPLAKAGIMIRESIAANSRNVFAFISPGTGGNENCYYQERTSIGGATARSGAYASSSAYPYWLKLVKSGNTYISYRSTNGTAWTVMYANRTVVMGNNVMVGLAVNSMNNSIASETVFDNIAFTLTDSPSINPNGGYFQLSRQVTLSSPIADSQIRYTIDGRMPTEESPLYSAPFTIDANRTVKARIFKTDYNPGPTATAIFNQPGLMVKYFSGAWATLPDFSKMDPCKVSMIPKLDYPDNYGHIMTSERSDNVGAVISGQINCPIQGSYTFYLSSGEGATLYLDGTRIINSPALRTFAQSVSPAISLTPGLHDIKIEYFEATGSGGIQLKWSYQGQTATIIPPGSFSSRDTDADGLPDQWEICKFGNLNHTGTEDTDNDGISDKEELNLYFSDPSDPVHPFAELTLNDIASRIAVSYSTKNNRTWTYVPDLDNLPRYFTGDGLQPQIKYASGTGAFASSGVKTNVAAQLFGFIDIPSDGLYIFYLNSDDGANLYIDNNKIIDNDGSHIMREAYGYVSLRGGIHQIKVNYYQTTSTSGLILSYEGPGVPKQIVPESAFFHSPLILSKMMENKDSDCDGLSDTYEKENALNPGLWDSDSDTISDGDEFTVQNGGSAKGILPEGWKDADVGGALAGSGKHDDADGIFTVRGAGILSPSATSEKINFCYQELSGDCEIIARIKTQPNTSPWAKAGIMIRKNLNNNCQYSYVYLTPNNGINYVQRSLNATVSSTNLAGGAATAPYWLKLVKKGKTYTPFKSADGTFWSQIGTVPQTIDMGDIVNVGLAVTSMRDNMPSPVDFDNFSISRTLTEKPDISPNGGYFQTSRQIILKSSIPDTQIRYTLDENEPNELSAIYTPPLNITASCKLKARAFKDGYNPSPISTAIFNQAGLMVKYYTGNWTTLPDFTKLTPYMASMIPNIDYPDNYGHIMTSGLCDNLGALITGQLNCPIQGTYTFYLSSSEGAALYVDGKRIIYSPKLRTFAQTVSTALTLAAGFHDIKVEYFEASGAGGIQLRWSYPGQTPVIIPKELFFSRDADADGLPDQWETHRFGNLNHNGTEDTDGDGISDKDELNFFFTDPSNPASKPSVNVNPTEISNQIAVTYCAKNKRTWLSVPDFDRLPHYGATSVNQVNYPMSATKFATGGTATNVASQFIGLIDIPAEGFYKFYLNCDDGANLYIDNRKIVDNDGLHTMREAYGFASLRAGKHNIRVDYYQTTYYNGLILSYEGPGLPKQVVPASALFHSPKYLLDMINTNDPDSDGINTITASAGANGSINPCGAVKLEYGANQAFSITPDTNYRVSDVLVDGVSAGAITSYEFINVKQSHTISANFALHTHAVTFDLAGKGTREGGGELNQSVMHENGAIVPTVNANEGWIFCGWDKSFDNITADTTVTAQYSRITYTVTFLEGSNGTITEPKVQTVNQGDSCEPVTSVPSPGYHFVNWTGDLESIENPLAVSNVKSDMKIIANFASNSNPLYMLSFIVKENGSISGTNIQRIYSGESSTPVTAIPSGSYHFVNWTGTGGFAATTDNPLTVTSVTADMTIKANFAIYRLFISENPLKINEGETSYCSISLLEPPLSDLNVTVSFDSGYNGINLLSPYQLTFTQANWNLPQTIQFSCANDNDADSKTATFKLSGLCETSKLYLMENEKDIVISVNADNNGSVSPSGRISKRIGDAFAVTATPDANFLFDHWEGGVPEDKIHDNPLELIIDTPCAITAVFSNNYRALLKVNDVPSEWMTVTPKINGGWESDISLYGAIADKGTYLDDLDLKVYLDATQTSNISDGFESGTISNWTFALDSEGVISVVDTPTFSGNKSLKIAGAQENAQGIYYPTSAADKDSKLGFYVYLPVALKEGDGPSAVWYNGVCVSFCYQENGNYSVRLGGSISGTVTHNDIAASTWNYIELDFDHFVDTDFDGMDDDWEIRNFCDLSQDGNGDFDHDGISNLQEFLSGKDPINPGPKVFFPADFTKVNKSAGTVNIEVKIEPAPQKFPISAQIHLLDSTAKSGEDFNFSSPQTVIFGIGQTTKTIPVAVISGEPTGAPQKFVLFGLTPQRGIGIGINESFILYINEIAEDTDNDGLPDWWEMKYFGNLNQGPDGDPDGDGVTNLIEYKQGRHPNAGAKPDRTDKLKLEVSF